MSDQLRDWLPTQAGDLPGVRTRIEGAVAEWAAQWFAADAPGLMAWSQAAQAPALGEAAWRDCGGGLQASCSVRAGARLAGLALGARAEQGELTERDRSLLSALSRRIVDDLAARLRRLLGAEGMQLSFDACEPRFVARIAQDGDTLFALSVPFPLLIRLCRQVLPRPRPAGSALQSVRAAAAPAGINLEVTLGSATLDLGALRALAVGDLLVLDTAVTDPVVLSVRGAAVGCGLLTDVDGKTALLLQHPQ